MTEEILAISIAILIFANISAALPSSTRVEEASNEAIENSGNLNFGYAGTASQIIATNLLKDSIDIDGNHVYSPLGIASVLAILAEGSEGETYNEFTSSFGYPQQKTELRESFRRLLGNYRDGQDNGSTNPTFRTWFYIYRNNSACDEYKRIIRDFYFVEVKDINRQEYDWSAIDTSPNDAAKHENSKDVVGFESLKKSQIFDEGAAAVADDVGLDDVEKESSKFDKFVDDKQYVETPLIKQEIDKEQTMQSPREQTQKEEVRETAASKQDVIDEIGAMEEKPQSPVKRQNDDDDELMLINVEENETIKADEKIDALRKNFADSIVPDQIMMESNEPERITIPLERLTTEDGAGEMMEALGSHFSTSSIDGARTLFKKDDIASALSANSITGREVDSKTKMLLFNGLYYRGNWAYPFQELRSSPLDVFYVGKDRTIPVKMMRSRGKFRVAECPSLRAQAVEFPYENPRYSLIVLLPKERDGLRHVLEQIEPADLQGLSSHLEEKSVYVNLPKFQIEETSRSEDTLKRLGLQRLFSRGSADFSPLSKDSNLHVDEIVQFVNIRVDEGASSENALTASNPVSRSDGEPDETIRVDRPFVYFVMDRSENFVIMSGKVCAPEYKEEEDNVDLSIEYSLA